MVVVVVQLEPFASLVEKCFLRMPSPPTERERERERERTDEPSLHVMKKYGPVEWEIM
jgi:hypothetical protein